jgi:hypothetical protein
LSPRDLPLWARGATAALLLIAGWYVSHSEGLAGVVGYSTLDLSAGVVAAFLLLGMRLPPDVWPQHPLREPFSLPWALAAAVVMAGLILVARWSGVPALVADGDKGLLVAVVVGGAVWAVAWGRIRQEAYLPWYGWAAAAALAPLAARIVVMLASRELPSLQWGTLLQVGAFFLVVGSTVALVTQELAFRRVLIGQAGDAGLAVVLISAALFGAWAAVAPDLPGGALQSAVSAGLHGIVLGSLYLLSRSLLVPALYQGVSTAAARAFDIAALPVEGATPYDGRGLVGMVVTGCIAAFMAYQVGRRSGFMGLLTRRHLPDAVSD